MATAGYLQAAACLDALARLLPALVRTIKRTHPHTAEFSAELTAAVCRTVSEYGGELRRRMPLDCTLYSKAGTPRQGHIETYATFPDGSSLAIEIDRANSRNGLQRLEYAANYLGAVAVWIRWAGRLKLQPDHRVYLLDLTDAGGSVRRRHRASPLRTSGLSTEGVIPAIDAMRQL